MLKKSFKINVFTWDPIIWIDVWLNYNVCITNSSRLSFFHLNMSNGNLPCIDVSLATIALNSCCHNQVLVYVEIIIMFVWRGQNQCLLRKKKTRGGSSITEQAPNSELPRFCNKNYIFGEGHAWLCCEVSLNEKITPHCLLQNISLLIFSVHVRQGASMDKSACFHNLYIIGP